MTRVTVAKTEKGTASRSIGVYVAIAMAVGLLEEARGASHLGARAISHAARGELRRLIREASDDDAGDDEDLAAALASVQSPEVAEILENAIASLHRARAAAETRFLSEIGSLERLLEEWRQTGGTR